MSSFYLHTVFPAYFSIENVLCANKFNLTMSRRCTFPFRSNLLSNASNSFVNKSCLIIQWLVLSKNILCNGEKNRRANKIKSSPYLASYGFVTDTNTIIPIIYDHPFLMQFIFYSHFNHFLSFPLPMHINHFEYFIIFAWNFPLLITSSFE